MTERACGLGAALIAKIEKANKLFSSSSFQTQAERSMCIGHKGCFSSAVETKLPYLFSQVMFTNRTHLCCGSVLNALFFRPSDRDRCVFLPVDLHQQQLSSLYCWGTHTAFKNAGTQAGLSQCEVETYVLSFLFGTLGNRVNHRWAHFRHRQKKRKKL